jgi:hypothetical protein
MSEVTIYGTGVLEQGSINSYAGRVSLFGAQFSLSASIEVDAECAGQFIDLDVQGAYRGSLYFQQYENSWFGEIVPQPVFRAMNPAAGRFIVTATRVTGVSNFERLSIVITKSEYIVSN